MSTERLASSDLHAYKITLDSVMRKSCASGSHLKYYWLWGQTKLCYGMSGTYQMLGSIFRLYPAGVCSTPNNYKAERSSKYFLGSKVTLVVTIQRTRRNQKGVGTAAKRILKDNVCLGGNACFH